MKKDAHRDRMMGRVRQAFLIHGYDQLTMIGLAKACDLTRRALYHHFGSKEEAFREMLRWRHIVEINAGFEAGERVLADGGSALDAIVAIFDARYGEARRDLELSPHASEINNEAFRRCRDVMANSAIVFQERLAMLLGDLTEKRLLRPRPGHGVVEIAQFLTDGARGVNQSLPPKPANTLPQRYRDMCAVILYGCADDLTEFPGAADRAPLP
jgi:AcrR family transcriptional regulator